MFALAALMSTSVFAQNNDAERLPGYKTTFEGNGFWNNWYMSLNFGAQSLFAENSKDAKFRNTITFMPTLSVGKWFNPYWGVRLQGTGGSLHGFTSGANSMLHYQYGAVHADFMFGLINFFAPYKEKCGMSSFFPKSLDEKRGSSDRVSSACFSSSILSDMNRKTCFMSRLRVTHEKS